MSFGMPQPRREPEVVVYGTDWCAATQMIRRHLQRRRIPYRYVDLEGDPRAAAQVRWWTGGAVKHPTVHIDGAVLVEPKLDELEWALAPEES
jgi:mycoredoxin